MPTSKDRIARAFAHQTPDRTPLFEIFQPGHPIHWPICGRNIGTDQGMKWDARADGVAWEELAEAECRAAFEISKFFGLDMVRLGGCSWPNAPRPEKLGKDRWLLNGAEYIRNERTQMVELAHPGEKDAYSRHMIEEDVIRAIENWDGMPGEAGGVEPMYRRVRELAEADGIDWVYMGEIGAGTGVAFYPPFMLMWLLAEPELFVRWLEMQKAASFPRTRALVEQGHTVIAMGGDVSSDKGPIISPALFHEYVFPAIKEHVDLIHQAGAKAVYTSDGNLWELKDDIFFNSGIDGYKEVDRAAGMTFPRLIAEGIDQKVCIIGNMDARYTLCMGTPAQMREEVLVCLRDGQHTPGGHILHASHSVHEDVKAENYYAAINAYREFFGMEPLPEVDFSY